MKKPIAVVTGGAGFIGSHMVDLLLSKEYSVRIIDNLATGREQNLIQHKNHPNLQCEWLDINTLDTQSLIFSDADYIFHFAGIGEIVPSIEAPIDYMATNVQGTVRVLECGRAAGIKKFVYAASSSCYGLAAVPTREDHPIAPQYPYALSKYLGECAVLHWHQVYGFPANSIRIFNAYGPRVRTTGSYGAVFGVFLKQYLEGCPLTVVGDGEQSRDFLYVTDVVKAFFAAATTQLAGEVWNLGAGNPQSINHLVKLIGGKKAYLPKRPGEPDCTWADIRKIQEQLKWKPEISFETGVSNMMADIEYWQDAPLWDPASIAKATTSWFQYLGKQKDLAKDVT